MAEKSGSKGKEAAANGATLGFEAFLVLLKASLAIFHLEKRLWMLSFL